jgi:hypothetical protein
LCSIELDDSSNDLFSSISLIKLMLFTIFGFRINFFNFILAFIKGSLFFIIFGFSCLSYLLFSFIICFISLKFVIIFSDNYCISIIFCYCYIYKMSISISFLFYSFFFSLNIFYTFLNIFFLNNISIFLQSLLSFFDACSNYF